jgi:TonB family protein
MVTNRPRKKHPQKAPRWSLLLLGSILLHLGLFVALRTLLPDMMSHPNPSPNKPVTLMVQLPEVVEPPPPEEPKLSGQIVDVAPSEDPERPVEADYLAEYDQVTEEETKTERFRVNPEILDHEYSEEDKVQFEDLLDLDVTKPSTGAQVGNDRFDPDEDGSLASLPSPFQVTNKEGMQKPVPASHRVSAMAGAPNNDLLNLPTADRLALNTQKIQFAGYLNRIRRLVNFYWDQNLQNLPTAARANLSRAAYQTEVFVVLDGRGGLESVEITQSSGSRPLDNAVVRAFQIAGPFPNPPEQLIAPDGRVYLPDFGFHVQTGQARAVYRGVDPRAGVRFPGILKASP